MSYAQILEHLTTIRNGFKKVDAITRELGERPEQEKLEGALAQREAVMAAEIDGMARELSAAFPDWQAKVKTDTKLRTLLSEAEDLMRSILRMDERLSFVLRRHMGEVQTELTSLYHTSRAAYSYTAQSRLRARRKN